MKQEQASRAEDVGRLQRQQAELEQTLLHISGAIQVLEELLAQERQGESSVSGYDLTARG